MLFFVTVPILKEQSILCAALSVACYTEGQTELFRPTTEDRALNAHLLSHRDLDLQNWMEVQIDSSNQT